MSSKKLPLYKFFALLFLIPGLFGLIVSAVISTSYLATLPRDPDPAAMRMTPREIHGVTVYETQAEDQTLSWLEYASMGVFLMGIALGVVYLEKWSEVRQARLDREILGQA
uniref:Uncharacterized protein n=1 Tax=mine drainage metagenome TaxID=410659 RepID=E6QLD3_9ZZZZ